MNVEFLLRRWKFTFVHLKKTLAHHPKLWIMQCLLLLEQSLQLLSYNINSPIKLNDIAFNPIMMEYMVVLVYFTQNCRGKPLKRLFLFIRISPYIQLIVRKSNVYWFFITQVYIFSLWRMDLRSINDDLFIPVIQLAPTEQRSSYLCISTF